MSTPEVVGANLEELEKAGLSELPAIADTFTAASSALSGVVTSGMFATGGPFSSNSPQADFSALMSALEKATTRTASVLDDVSAGLVTTARNLAREDEATKRAFLAAGGTLP